jgi:DNA-binding GntR family transcriptional regulator
VNTSPHLQILERIRAEYLEMPGMRLKVEQVQRLFGVDPSVCRTVLDSLVECKFLYANPDGTYVRFTDDCPHARPLKAELTFSSYSRRAS